MSRIILMALVLAATVAGCNRFPDLTIQITDNLQPSDAPECAFESEQDESLLRGLWDLNVDSGYIMVPRIASYIFDNSLATQAPQGNITVANYEVAVKLPDNSIPELSGGLPNPYSVTTSPVIPPSQAFGEISRGIGAAIMIPASYRNALLDLAAASGFSSIVLDIRANGNTAGGFFQQSPPFSWPIDLCQGCLGIVCTEGEIPEVCFPGQDGDTYCTSIVPPAL